MDHYVCLSPPFSSIDQKISTSKRLDKSSGGEEEEEVEEGRGGGRRLL